MDAALGEIKPLAPPSCGGLRGVKHWEPPLIVSSTAPRHWPGARRRAFIGNTAACNRRLSRPSTRAAEEPTAATREPQMTGDYAG